MKMSFVTLFACVCLSALSVGCYTTEEGHKKWGSPLAKDKIESQYERKPAEVLAATKDVLGYMGTVTGDNTITRVVQARIDNSYVWVRVDEIQPGICKVTTQARGKGGGGNIDLASEVDKQIALQLQAR
jgi:hypothetical protein